MLRDVIVHIANEQPILADLLVDPKPSDVVLICTRLRTMGGKKPVFIDKTESTFILPLAHIRFVEIPETSVAASDADKPARPGKALAKVKAAAQEAEDEEYDAVPLGRLAWLAGVSDEPPSVEPSGEGRPAKGEKQRAAEPDAEPDDEPVRPNNPDELDPDLLRRIHEV